MRNVILTIAIVAVSAILATPAEARIFGRIFDGDGRPFRRSCNSGNCYSSSYADPAQKAAPVQKLSPAQKSMRRSGRRWAMVAGSSCSSCRR